jgi:hypothetical protein
MIEQKYQDEHEGGETIYGPSSTKIIEYNGIEDTG